MIPTSMQQRLGCRVSLLVVLWLGAFGPAIAEPYLHAPSGFECPDQVAGFTRVGIDDYESKQRGLGVACKYQVRKDLFADVYLFTAGLNTVPADISDPVMLQLRGQTVSEIEQYAQSRGEQSRKVNATTLTVQTDRGPVQVFYDSFVISSPNGARNTWMWLWTARKHVMKIRMTRPPAGDVDPKMVREFYESIVRLAAS